MFHVLQQSDLHYVVMFRMIVTVNSDYFLKQR
jgi:hypothetical protein